MDRLLKAYRQIKQNFMLGHHEPSELNGGKFCEILVRMLEYEVDEQYTPLGQKLGSMGDKLRSFENKSNSSNSVRFHLPRVANAIYHVRNQRGVGHVGGDVDPNVADSTLIATAADWAMAELVRVHYSCSLEDAQALVNSLVQRSVPLVHRVNGKTRVLNPALSFTDQVLVILAEHSPESVTDKFLLDSTEHSNFSVFKRDVLRRLHKRRLIEYSDDSCTILPPGLARVESEYAEWMARAPTRVSGERRRKQR